MHINTHKYFLTSKRLNPLSHLKHWNWGWKEMGPTELPATVGQGDGLLQKLIEHKPGFPNLSGLLSPAFYPLSMPNTFFIRGGRKDVEAFTRNTDS